MTSPSNPAAPSMTFDKICELSVAAQSEAIRGWRARQRKELAPRPQAFVRSRLAWVNDIAIAARVRTSLWPLRAGVAAVVLALSVTTGSGQSRTNCAAPANSAPFPSNTRLTSEADISVGKEIGLGDYRHVNALRSAYGHLPCPLRDSASVDEAIGRSVSLNTKSTVNAAEQVDLLLVLASDTSRSIDEVKFKLQRDGYIAAIRNPRVIEVIRAGPRGRIAVCFLEWSGVGYHTVVVDWTLIDSAEAAQDFVERLNKAPRLMANFTSISGGIDFAMVQLKRAPFYSARHVIDVSGDGANNSGRSVTEARDDALAGDVTINGLVILSEQPLEWDPSHTHPPGGLEDYYRENVIGGPNSFVEVAESFNSFGHAIFNKLITEIAGTNRPEERRIVGSPTQSPGLDSHRARQ